MSESRSNQKSEICVRIFTFAGYASGQHVIEGRDAICGDKQKIIANGVEVAHFTASNQRNRAKIRCKECSHRRAFQREIKRLIFEARMGRCQCSG